MLVRGTFTYEYKYKSFKMCTLWVSCHEDELLMLQLPLLFCIICVRCWVVSGWRCGSLCEHHAKLSSSASGDNKVMQYLQARIKANGPITVAEYMKTVLTSAESVGILYI